MGKKLSDEELLERQKEELEIANRKMAKAEAIYYAKHKIDEETIEEAKIFWKKAIQRDRSDPVGPRSFLDCPLGRKSFVVGYHEAKSRNKNKLVEEVESIWET